MSRTGSGTSTPHAPGQRGAFVAGAGLELDELIPTRVVGQIELGPEHHTRGIVQGPVYATAAESAASLGASAAGADGGMVAVGLANTTHFLRPFTSGRATVEAVPLNQGRTRQLWRVDIKDDAGRLIAHGELRLQNLAASSPPTAAIPEGLIQQQKETP